MKKILLLSAALLLMYSCSSDDSSDEETTPETEVAVEEETEETTDEETPVVEEENLAITYDRDVAPLIANRCFRCHNSPTANGAPSRSTWVNFDIVSDNAARINARVANGTMPPSGGLAQAERDIIAQWIADGMLEN